MAEKKVIPGNKKEVVKSLKKRVDEKLKGPGKYEVKKDDTFTIPIAVAVKGKRWVIVNTNKSDKEDAHEVVFKMWRFDEEIELRKRATSFDMTKRMHTIDQDILNRLKIQTLLKSWTFDEENHKLALFHSGGVLTDESWEIFKSLQINITRYIIERMNEILEYNG